MENISTTEILQRLINASFYKQVIVNKLLPVTLLLWAL